MTQPNQDQTPSFKSFPVQWVFRGKHYGLSTTALRARLKCYVTHIPFTRRLLPRFHELICGSLIIVPLDGWITGKKMMHEMRERGFEL